jgi:hypothetical protein
LNVPLEEVLRRAGLSVPVAPLPIVALADASLRILDNEVPDTLPVVPAPPSLPPNAEAVLCHTPSSTMFGWIFAYVASEKIEPTAVGHLSCVRLRDGTELIRFLKPSLVPDRFDLVSLLGARPVRGVEVLTATPVLYIRP